MFKLVTSVYMYFRPKHKLNLTEPDKAFLNNNFIYLLIGIRKEILKLESDIRKQERRTHAVGFNGFEEELPPGILDEIAMKTVHGRVLSKGEIGCARSHQLAYQSVSGLQGWAIFLEDDMVVVGSVSSVENVLSQITSEPALVLLEYGESQIQKFPKWWKRSRSHAYALNSAAIELINQSYSQIFTVADWPIQWVFEIRFYQLDQRAFKLEESSPSLIQDGRNEIIESSLLVTSKNFSTKLFWFRSLLRLLRLKGVKNPIRTSFFAVQNGLY